MPGKFDQEKWEQRLDYLDRPRFFHPKTGAPLAEPYRPRKPQPKSSPKPLPAKPPPPPYKNRMTPEERAELSAILDSLATDLTLD